MKALFIGGTGVISTEITKLCVQRGFDITLLNRGKSSGKLPDDIKVKRWSVDIHDESSVAKQLEGQFFDVVVNFINFTPDEIERDIGLFAGKTNQYIFISSASAYQKPLSNYLVKESTPLSNPYWEYSRNKIACEERLIYEYRHNGFPFTIVRPSHTYDDQKVPVNLYFKSPWPTLKRMMDGRPVLLCGDGTSLWPLTHSRDFSTGFVGLMGNVRAIGESVHITTDEALSWNQIYAAIGNALGVTPRPYYVSTDFIVSCDPSQRGNLIGDKSNTLVFDNSKIKALVPDFTATIRFDQGVKKGINHYLNTPALQEEEPDFDRFTDTIIAAQENARLFFKQQYRN